ncbi:MAG TPA: YbaK/EbsC family protein [Gemmatimonadales bacterium]|nr:YbaK/EbsC family protein [Gemmatimonadales bacterium]
MSAVLAAIRHLLHEHGVAFREVHHPPTRTSEESARARGEPLEVGGKAIVLKVGDTFRLFVLSAARSLDSAAIKRHFAVKKTRFATGEELESLTGLAPGAVPPFGRPILDLDLWVDRSIVNNERIAFNAGSLTDSIIMSVRDYLTIARPEVLDFSRDRVETDGGT